MEDTLPISQKSIQKMIKVAKQSRRNAFAIRSMHKIGSSVLMTDGTIIGGCNVESVISGLGICAERCALDNSVSNGEYDIVAVCTIDSKFTPTCGACLQYIMLFSQAIDRDIWLINGDFRGHYRINKLSEIFPNGYRTSTKNLPAIQKFVKQQIAKKGKKK